MKNSDQDPVANADRLRIFDNEVRIGLQKLKARIAQGRLSEAEFVEAVSEIVAATPADIGPIDGLLIAQDIRKMEQVWRASLERPLS